MGMTGISKSQVSRLCGEIDGKITAFLERPLEGEWPYVWLDATYVKARRDGPVVSDAPRLVVWRADREVMNYDGGRDHMPATRRDRKVLKEIVAGFRGPQ